MRLNTLRKIKTVQKLQKFSKNCFLKKFFKNTKLDNYNNIPTDFDVKRTTKYVPICQIQGNFKRTLKIFQFNRHIVRSNLHKKNFNSLHTNSW